MERQGAGVGGKNNAIVERVRLDRGNGEGRKPDKTDNERRTGGEAGRLARLVLPTKIVLLPGGCFFARTPDSPGSSPPQSCRYPPCRQHLREMAQKEEVRQGRRRETGSGAGREEGGRERESRGRERTLPLSPGVPAPARGWFAWWYGGGRREREGKREEAAVEGGDEAGSGFNQEGSTCCHSAWPGVDTGRTGPPDAAAVCDGCGGGSGCCVWKAPGGCSRWGWASPRELWAWE